MVAPAIELATDATALYGDPSPAPVRGRQNLPSGDSPLLPETIGRPQSCAFPLAVTAPQGGSVAEPEAYAEPVRRLLDEEGALERHGAVLLRGLPVSTPEDFGRFCAALGWKRNQLGGGGTARTILGNNVRTASDEPPEHTIEPHLDMAHNAAFPHRIAFFMQHGPPPGVGGETVLTDMRAVTADMKAAGLDAEFERRGGVLYTKKLWSAARVEHSFTWQRRFFSEAREGVEEQLRQLHRTEWEWTDDETLVTRNWLPAVAEHPGTREALWFNGIHTNHRDYFDLAPHIDTTDGSPFDSSYGDGTPIDDETLARIRASIWRNSVAVALRSGDVVIVDNMLAAHGRMGWTPGAPRKMLLTHFE